MDKVHNIWELYSLRLLNFIKSKVNLEDAEDILQEVFLKTILKLDTLKENQKLESWLFQITRHTIIDYYRKKQKEYNFSESFTLDSYEETKNNIELSHCIRPMIERLPEKYKSSVLKYEFEGKSQIEISKIENKSLSAIKSRIQRGRKLLKSMLYDCCKFELDSRKQPISCQSQAPCDKSC